MCGIAGWYNRDGRPVEGRALAAMSDVMVHRGPDSDGQWVSGPVGLAHRRLAIRDLSALGHQPLCDAEQRVYVTYNGEIYNEAELRRTLEREFGFRFRSTCDTELLPYAYLAWGEAMFDRLEGMYAIGLWDVKNERLLLARDGIGIKPLLFAEVNGSVVFASEMKGILASRLVNPRLEPSSLHTYLAAGHAGPASTLVSGVHQVPPGSVVCFSREGRRDVHFWEPKRQGDITDEATALDMLASALDEVVDSQLISDVPLSVLQSGGIDSTLVSLSVGRRGANAPLFTASFNEPSHDEVDLARRVAVAASLQHRVIPGDASGDLSETFRAIVYHFDAQCADTGALGFYSLSQAVRQHCTVALSGDGGDEFFAGYETYAATRVAEVLRHIVPAPLARAVGSAAYGANPQDETRLPISSVIARFGAGLGEGAGRPHLQWRRLLPAALTPKVYGPAMAELASTSPYAEYAAYYDSAPGGVLDRAMLADQRFHLQSVLAKVDAMSMAHSLEIRVPLLDRRVMNLAGRMSTQLLNRFRGHPKAILRALAERLGAPKGVTAARKKGFNVPIARLLRRELAPLGDQILTRNADVLAPYLDADGVRSLWQEHKEGRANHAFALWPILMLAVWRAGLAAPAARARMNGSGAATAAA
jgi:asparagine synthase (glutamine-hydrolysing)